MSGRTALNRPSASAGTFASVPPFTGSITITGLLCLRATSQQFFDCTPSLSQSR